MGRSTTSRTQGPRATACCLLRAVSMCLGHGGGFRPLLQCGAQRTPLTLAMGRSHHVGVLGSGLVRGRAADAPRLARGLTPSCAFCGLHCTPARTRLQTPTPAGARPLALLLGPRAIPAFPAETRAPHVPSVLRGKAYNHPPGPSDPHTRQQGARAAVGLSPT